LENYADWSLQHPDSSLAVNPTTARWLRLGAHTGQGVCAVRGLAGPMGFLSGALPGGGYLLGGAMLYGVGQHLYNYWQMDWSRMDLLDHLEQTVPLAAGVLAGGTPGARRSFQRGYQQGLTYRPAVRDALADCWADDSGAAKLPGGGHSGGRNAALRAAAKRQALLDIEEEALRNGEPVPGIHEPGEYAVEGIPTQCGAPYRTKAINTLNDANGNAYGCHICGRKTSGRPNGDWIHDHIPATSLTKPGEPQVIYPSCQACSDRQGRLVLNRFRLRELLDLFGE
jgi:hypothetical protein